MNQTPAIESPIGPVSPVFSRDGLAALWLGTPPPSDRAPGVLPAGLLSLLRAELGAYFGGHAASFSVPLAPRGTPFQRQVWDVLLTIPPGQTRSYAEVARLMGRPTAVRAVARANATNPIAIIIPCHRVIGSDGTLTGYAGGLDRKRWLLAHETRWATPAARPGQATQPVLAFGG